MKKNFNMIKVYVEAILYSIMLVIAIFLCLTDNIYITMFPIAIALGAVGQVLFGKRVMTSFFSGILTLVLVQIKQPSQIGNNFLIMLKTVILVLIGEAIGWAFKRLYRLSKKKKNIGKKIKKEKLKCAGICGGILVLGLVISSILNGNYISYSIAKNSLKNYCIQEYSSSSRMKITKAKYEFSLNPKYVFYTEDTMANNTLGKFSVYTMDKYSVQDDYKEQVANLICNKLNKEIEKKQLPKGIEVYVTNSDTNQLTISFIKKVDNIQKIKIEQYAKEIVACIEKLETIVEFEQIYQMKIVLESKANAKENLASYIYMNSYNEMLQKYQGEVYTYIMSALNVEYFD